VLRYGEEHVQVAYLQPPSYPVVPPQPSLRTRMATPASENGTLWYVAEMIPYRRQRSPDERDGRRPMLGRRTLMATAAALAAPRTGRAASSQVLRYVRIAVQRR
jgi:hypothetical protein